LGEGEEGEKRNAFKGEKEKRVTQQRASYRGKKGPLQKGGGKGWTKRRLPNIRVKGGKKQNDRVHKEPKYDPPHEEKCAKKKEVGSGHPNEKEREKGRHGPAETEKKKNRSK